MISIPECPKGIQIVSAETNLKKVINCSNISTTHVVQKLRYYKTGKDFG